MEAKEFFERFEVDYTQSIDSKGLGTVYLGNDILNGTNCAIKVIEIHKSFDKSIPLNQFNKATDLKAEFLMPYLGICKIESEETVQYFLAMPYFPLGNLADGLSKIELAEKKNLILKITDGLVYLHEKGIVWQQLRAEHILLDKSESLYQPVFINYAQDEILPKMFFHNYEYLSPEQISADKENIDFKTDIWSFGVLVYYVYTSVLPFGKKTTQHPNKKIADRIVNDSLEIPDNIPEVFKVLIQKCLNKEKQNRWNSVKEIRDYINSALPENIQTVKKEPGILQTLEKMGEDLDVEEKEPKIIPILQRSIKRKPAKPVRWWEPFMWILIAVLVGYIMSLYLK
jgi:serine/threonine protein kinase